MKNKFQLERLKKNILAMLEEKLPSCYHYHNVAHTVNVIENTGLLGKEAGLSERDQILLETAAVLHDCGYLEIYKNNEPKGAEFAKHILPQYGYDENDIMIIAGLILATSLNVEPETRLEKLMRDADVGYVGTDEFGRLAENLRREIEEVTCPVTDRQWYEFEQQYLQKFKFYTPEANKLFGGQLNKNRDEIDKILDGVK